MYISKTSRPIAIKLYQKHHCGGGLPVLGFEADKIRTLVSMATDSSHRLILGKSLSNTLAASILIETSSFLQVMRTTIKSQMSSKFSQSHPWSVELAALEHLKKSP